MKKSILILTFTLLSGTVFANDFPTQARVEYALLCMKEQGGQTIQNLYACSCSVDKLSEKLTYDQFVEAETRRAMINTPGEKGGAFRDVPNAREFLRSIDKMKTEALKSCTVRTQASGQQQKDNQ